MRVVVLSTGNASPSREKCKASVAAQSIACEHIYIDAAEQKPAKPKIQNQVEAIASLPPDAFVAMVDGDDWLPHQRCIERAVQEHAAGAWMTWGNFQFADGRPGFADHYGFGEHPRHCDWKLTHLKTFRAGLFQRLRDSDLHRDGEWLQHATDLVVMFGIYELCPPERRCLIRDVIYTYNIAASYEWNTDEAGLAREAEDVAYVRSLPLYEPIEAL